MVAHPGNLGLASPAGIFHVAQPRSQPSGDKYRSGFSSQAGSRRPLHLAENVETLDIEFSADGLAALDEAFAPGAIVGDRYPAFVQKYAAQ